MTLHRVPSYDDTLANNSPTGSTQFESFPPLYITRSNVLNTPSLRLEPMPSKHPEPQKEPGSRRWFILSLSCLLLFGNYFAYDNPAALNTQLQKYLGMPYNDYQYLLSTLYSVYSLPNTVLPFLFGSLVDRFGPQRVLLILSSCVCIGQAIFAVGVQTRQIWMMLLGRAIFGVGGESCGVAQASITTMQFRGHELAFALGLNLCIARFGSVVNTIVTPWAEQKWDVPTAIWIGTLSCVASFLSAIVLVWMIDERARPVVSLKEERDATPLLSDIPGASDFNNGLYLTLSPTNDEDFYESSPAARSMSHPAIIQRLPGILRREPSFAESIHSVRFTPGLAKSGTRPSIHIITHLSEEQDDSWWSQWCSDLKFFPSTFWLLCALTVLLYGTVVPFNNIASDFLQSKWYPDNPRMAAAVMGVPDTLGAILVPGFGLVVDRYGKRASTLIASAFIMVIVHTTLGFTMLNPIFAFSLLGIAYTMYGVALWPSIACVVTSELHLGKGYGISSSFLNISLTIVPPIVATIRVMGDGFLPVEMFFIGMGVCGICVGFALKNIDLRDGGALEESEIKVEVPVIVPQATTGSVSASAMASPALSHGRSRFLSKRKRPTLNVLQPSRSRPGSDWVPKRWEEEDQDAGGYQSSPLLPSKAQEDDGSISHSPWNSPTVDSPSTHAPSSSTLLSPMTDRMNRNRRWFGRPLLHRTLTRVGSPLLQQYSSSPRYGSFSTPSIVTSMQDELWDVEEGSRPVSGMEGYSVSQHPILYNPLRGSTGSFRISRNARPVAFGEGEEGQIYLNGHAVEPRYGDQDDDDDTDSDGQGDDSAGTEQDTAVGDENSTEDGAVSSSNTLATEATKIYP